MFSLRRKKEEPEEEEKSSSVRLRKSGEVRNQREAKDKKKKETKKLHLRGQAWGKKERYLVLLFFAGTSLLAAFLGLSAREWKLPNYPRFFEGVSLEKTYVLEPERTESEKAGDAVKEVNARTAPLTGVYSFYVSRLNEGVSYGYLEDEPHTAASMIKLPLMVYMLSLIDEGDISMSDTYRLRDADRAVGSGSMYNDEVGTVYSYKEMLTKMGQESDNTAYRAMLNILGEQELQNFIDEVGMRRTSLAENETTAADMGKLWKKIWKGNILSLDSRDFLVNILTDTIYEDHLPALLPEGVVVSHKYGREVNVVNDGGIVFARDPYVVVVISEGVRYPEADAAIPEISLIIYDFESGN